MLVLPGRTGSGAVAMGAGVHLIHGNRVWLCVVPVHRDGTWSCLQGQAPCMKTSNSLLPWAQCGKSQELAAHPWRMTGWFHTTSILPSETSKIDLLNFTFHFRFCLEMRSYSWKNPLAFERQPILLGAVKLDRNEQKSEVTQFIAFSPLSECLPCVRQELNSMQQWFCQKLMTILGGYHVYFSVGSLIISQCQVRPEGFLPLWGWVDCEDPTGSHSAGVLLSVVTRCAILPLHALEVDSWCQGAVRLRFGHAQGAQGRENVRGKLADSVDP